MPLRLIFMGTPEFAVPTLIEILARGHEVSAVYTRAPKPAGRGLGLEPSPIERSARQFGLPVFTPKTLRTDEAEATFRRHRADVAIVVAYGLILPKPILDAVPLGAFNLHASLLPRWRGAAPINRAIMAGDAVTGVTVMKMDERALAALERGALVLTPQPRVGATTAARIDKAETRIDWTNPWIAVHAHCRGLSPAPGAWFVLAGRAGDRIKVLRMTKGEGEGRPGIVLDERLTIACRCGAVRILELQRAGRRPMKTQEFLRGTRIPPGTVLG